MNYRILYEVELNERHKNTGNVMHYIPGLPPGDNVHPHILKIVQYNEDPGYYLFYCNINDVEMTDTYHDGIEQAFEQALYEFGVNKSEWEKQQS